MKISFFLFLWLACLASAEVIEADLLIVGGDESGCAAAVQAARLGVKRIDAMPFDDENDKLPDRLQLPKFAGAK